MSLDTTLLQVMKHRKYYDKLHRTVNDRAVDPRTKVILKDFGKYFAQAEECQTIPVETDFFTWFTMVAHRSLSDDDVAIYRSMFKEVSKEPAQESRDMLASSLLEADLAVQLSDAVQAYDDEKEIDLAAVLRRAIDQFELDTERKVKLPVVEASDDLFDDDTCNSGFRWRWPGLNMCMRPLRPGDFGILAGRPDKGKCLDPRTPVILASGEVVLARDVKVGDVLAGPHRNNVVLGTTSGQDTMFRVSYPWGEGYVVNSEHVLSLKRSKAEGRHRTGDVLNVPVKEYITWPTGRKERYKGWKAGVNYPEAALPMDPYLLGLWLGDGTRGKPQITTTDKEVLSAFEEAYGKHTSCYSGITYGFYKTRMISDLRGAGVYKDKSVPEQYLRASREQRLALLAGLIDSDGYAGDVYEVVAVSDKLKDGYVRLARSLGFHATSTLTFKRAVGTVHEGSWYWRVRIGSEAFGVVPVRLLRKVGNSRQRKRAGLHFGIKVEQLGVGEYAGFALDGDHLFLLGDYTVTHNTSALADNVTYMATQMDEVYGKGHGRSILWLNNEGPGNRILKRCVQTALGVPTSELVKLQQAGEVWKRYEEAIQGDKTLIKVLNIHGMKFWQVEEIMRQLKPGLVIFDMIDNLNFDGSVINGGQRTDQLLEGMYQATRELSVRFDCPMIATSQISVEGDGMSYPTQSMLKDSKTGKQGAADFIITVGARNEPGMETVRFIGLTKNKLHLEGQPQSPKSEMIFEGATGRYYEAQ